jgi:uncharacterized protein YoxC
MADEKQKLVAEISGDAKPMQQALDAAKKSVEQTAKAVNQTSQQTRQGYDRAAQAASKMGQTGASANMTVAQAVRHPIQAVKTLAIEAKNAAAALLGMGRAGRQAGAEVKEAGGALGALIGLGSKMAIIAKGFQSLKSIIETALLAPLRDAYKETERLAKMRLDTNIGIYGGKADMWSGAKKELEAYFAAYDKAMRANATEQDKLAERTARRNLERRGISIDTEGAPIETQIRQQLDNAQSEYIKALEGKEREVNKALADMKAAYEKLTAPGAEFLWGTNQGGYAAEVNRLQGEIARLSDQSTALRGEVMAAKNETPGEDFSSEAAAQAADRLAEEYDRQAKAIEEADRREEEARRRLAEAEERRADIERQLADEGRLEAMQHTRDLLNHQMGRFGFSLDEYDEENLSESNLDRVQRRRNVRLDARIEAKRQRLAEGRKVHFTPAELRRMDEWRALKAQGEGLTAEEKAMQAAKKQEDAARRLDDAAAAIQEASDAIKDAENARDEATRGRDAAEGARGLIANAATTDFFDIAQGAREAVPDYGSILEQIRGILDAQSDRIYVVK